MFRLRELERKDLPVINKWRNKEELISLLGAPFRFINVDVDIKWYESYMLNRNSAVRCAITEFDNDEILGLVSLTSINYVNLTAEFHIMIGEEKSCGKGMGTFAVKAMIEHAFYNMNLRRIELGVLADNYRALHVYEKVGFKKEGIKRQAIYKKGKYVDLISCAILRDEYPPRRLYLDGSVFPMLEVNDLVTKNYCIKRCCSNAVRDTVESSNYIEWLKKVHLFAKFIVIYGEDIFGCAAVYVNDVESKIAYLTYIAVHPDKFNHHYGSSLLLKIEEIALKAGMQKLKLEVRKINAQAIAFYKKSGFAVCEHKEESFYMIKNL